MKKEAKHYIEAARTAAKKAKEALQNGDFSTAERFFDIAAAHTRCAASQARGV